MEIKKELLIAILIMVVISTVINAVKINGAVLKKDDNEEELISLVKYEKNTSGEENSYNVTVKNTTGRYIEKVKIEIEDNAYELYHMQPEEEYEITYNSSKISEIKLIVDEINFKEIESNNLISLEKTIEDKKVKGTIKNISEEELYPLQIIYFVKNESGDIRQMEIHYEGCFQDGLVIKQENNFDFSGEIPDGYTFFEDKGVIVNYSDLSFKDVIHTNFK